MDELHKDVPEWLRMSDENWGPTVIPKRRAGARFHAPPYGMRMKGLPRLSKSFSAKFLQFLTVCWRIFGILLLLTILAACFLPFMR